MKLLPNLKQAGRYVLLGGASLGVTLVMIPFLLLFFIRTHAGQTPKRNS